MRAHHWNWYLSCSANIRAPSTSFGGPYTSYLIAVSLVNEVPFGGKKKGSDSGLDGLIYFKPDRKITKKAIVSVRGEGGFDAHGSTPVSGL